MRSLKALIGAECTERIQVTSRWEAWLDENGTAAGKPVNQATTRLAHAFGADFSLYGTVIIVGLDKGADAPASLSPAQASLIPQRMSAPATLCRPRVPEPRLTAEYRDIADAPLPLQPPCPGVTRRPMTLLFNLSGL